MTNKEILEVLALHQKMAASMAEAVKLLTGIVEELAHDVAVLKGEK